MYQPGFAATNCSACEIGFFADTPGSRVCTKCNCNEKGVEPETFCDKDSGVCNCLPLWSEEPNRCSKEQNLEVSYIFAYFFAGLMVAVLITVLHPKIMLLASISASIRGIVASKVELFREERIEAMHRKKYLVEKHRIEGILREAKLSLRAKRRKALFNLLYLFLVVLLVAIGIFCAYFLKFVMNVYLILKGSITLDPELYERKMDHDGSDV